MSSFVSAFNPVYMLSNVIYPVTETQISAREVGKDGLPQPSRELTVDSTIYDKSGKIQESSKHTLEIWA